MFQYLLSGSFYVLAGGPEGEATGYTGCLADLQVDNRLTGPRQWDMSGGREGLLVGECSVLDWCEGGQGPCQHGGLCEQLYTRAVCDCAGTGYTGAVCSTSRHWRSCREWAHSAPPHTTTAEVVVDVDGSGPLQPLAVRCGPDGAGRLVTAVTHDTQDKTKVDGFQARGSFSQDIHYQVSEESLLSLVRGASSCQQTVSYECHQSSLSDYAWWVSLSGVRTTFCQDSPCSCDQADTGWSRDILTVTDKSLLPVSAVFFGDTGTPFDEKEGRFSVGQLVCRHEETERVEVTRGPLTILTEAAAPPAELVISFSLTESPGELELVNVWRLERPGRPAGRLSRLRLESSGTLLLYEWTRDNIKHNVSIRLDLTLADGLWHLVMIEHNFMEVMMALDIESVVTRQMLGQRTDTDSQYLLQVTVVSYFILGVTVLSTSSSRISALE